MGSDYLDLHQDLADSTSGNLATSIDPQDGPKGESVKGKESPIVSTEDEGPPVRAVSRLKNQVSSADSFNLDSPLQSDVPKAHSLIRGKGSGIQQSKISHPNTLPPLW
ncbi:hypothetical protein Nepgr_020934 [Nepenthes gracilis]|uniref:Uncharacterized protein n=1 Tax=Nepenthes gracilis TaxID=150966 RepID=A0AAD3XVP1_NEPGR|nr:hypothetical protein Nepgr_020934 [Nepenthes gracilis]